MCHVAASVSENCGFLNLFYLSFKAFKSKLDTDTKKAHFKTTNTMASTNFNMNFIFDEWIIDDHSASKKGETFKCYPLSMSARSRHFSIAHPSQDQQVPKLRLFPLHNVNISLIITPPTHFTMLSFNLVVNFNC